MSELRERLREGADAAARDGQVPTAAVIMRRGRRRRVRVVGATALLVASLAAGMVGAGRLGDRPAPPRPCTHRHPDPADGSDHDHAGAMDPLGHAPPGQGPAWAISRP